MRFFRERIPEAGYVVGDMQISNADLICKSRTTVRVKCHGGARPKERYPLNKNENVRKLHAVLLNQNICPATLTSIDQWKPIAKAFYNSTGVHRKAIKKVICPYRVNKVFLDSTADRDFPEFLREEHSGVDDGIDISLGGDAAEQPLVSESRSDNYVDHDRQWHSRGSQKKSSPPLSSRTSST
eukprot:gene11725-12946_t